MTSLDSATLVGPLINRNVARTEADVQSAVRSLLLHGGLDLQDHDLDVRLEAQAGGQRRIDVEVGLAIIEVKKDLRVGGVKNQAIEQLAGYVERRRTDLGQRYVGILTDGVDWILYDLTSVGELIEVDRLTVRDADDGPRLVAWLSAILSTTEHLAPTPIEIERRFGALSPGHALDRSGLRDLWDSHSSSSELQLKFELWGKLLRTAFGERFTDAPELFIEHTYLVIVAEIIAHELIGIGVETLDPADLVTGRFFTESGVYGVVESDFFDWPAEVPGGKEIIHSIARRVARFDWGGVAHDVLKHLYESVISAEDRHGLGEYYTPDWLAAAVVEKAITEPATQRVLDPACGSGTFVFQSVRAVIAARELAGDTNREILDHVTRNVFGMDVHPVAVTLARVTYLLAIGPDRLSHDRGELSVPIYLGDSVQWQLDHKVLGADGLTVSTDDDAGLFSTELIFPTAVLDDPARFDRLVSRLTERATNRARKSPVPKITEILTPFGVSTADTQTITATFKQLCDLHDNFRNHIWGYYVRNLARPLWLTRSSGRVDVLVGNPPWLSYRFMHQAMKKAYRERTKERALWEGGRIATQQDLATYFVVRSCELYLKDFERFAFVMPLATLSRKPALGFRKGVWGVAGIAQFEAAWDLSAVRPHVFPVPSCVVMGTFDRSPSVDNVRLKGANELWSGNVDPSSSWGTAQGAITREEVEPEELPSAPQSPYSGRFLQGATIVPRVLHIVREAQVTGGLGLPAGLIRVESRRSAQEKDPWRSLPDRGPAPVERRFVKDTYFGAHVLPFRTTQPVMSVLPITDGQVLDKNASELDRYPRLAAWWRDGVRHWEEHNAGQLELRDRIDFQRTLSSQLERGPHCVVYTKSGVNLTAARLESRDAIIDHTLYWASVSGVGEGRYLTAILNAEATLELVAPFQSEGNYGKRHFDMYVWYLPIPEFDAENPLHDELTELARHAETVAAEIEIPADTGFRRARTLVKQALIADSVEQEINDAVVRLLAGPELA